MRGGKKKHGKKGERVWILSASSRTGPCAKKAEIFIKKTGADWPVYGHSHRGQLMQRVHLNWERRVADSFFNLGEAGANEPEVIPLQSQLYIK